jgi:AcrR family transcriptional regulator
MPKGTPLTEEEQTRRRREIFDAAVHLFLEKGFNETSMREIAEAAGAGKSTLYDYFSSKDEILLSVVEEELNNLTRHAQVIAREPIATQEKLRQVIFAYMDYLVANEAFFMKLSLEVQRMAQNSQARIQQARHMYQDVIQGLIETGIQEGSLRQTDPLLASRILLTALSPAVYTTRPSGTRTQMMEAAFNLLMNGLKA